MQASVCVASDMPVLNSLVITIGPFVDAHDPILPSAAMGSKKRRRTDSISDVTDSDREKSRQSKKRSDVPAGRPETSMLTDAIWNKIQAMIIASKNLRDFTRVMLAFFKEHEIAQMRMSRLQQPVYPVAIPVTEVYSMLAPKKRRAYDVLHVLEGVGVLKRIHDKNPNISRFRGGQFLYFGREGAKKRLEAIRRRVQSILQPPICPSDGQKADAMVMAACNSLATLEGWPSLAATTLSFLSFVLQDDSSSTIPLSRLNRRLVDARIACDQTMPVEGRDDFLAEVNRRVYDVVSVLASLNIVILSSLADELKPELARVLGRATPRKAVTFNVAVFSNPSLIRVGSSCASRVEASLAAEKVKADAKSRQRCDVSTQVGAKLRQGCDAPTQVCADSNALDVSAMPWLSTELDDSSIEDLFPDIQPSDCAENLADWWDVPLRDMLFRDALPPVDFLDWEIMQALSRSRLRTVGDPTTFVTSKECDNHLVEEADLECHEELEAA